MDIFRSVTKSVLGAPQGGDQPSGAETVERLLDRVQSSTLLEDRRDGCRALKALSRKFRLFVGAHGMDTLIQVLESDRIDHEIMNYALETLVNVTSDEVFTEEGEEETNSEEDSKPVKIGEQFTEIFIKRPENVSLVVSLLDESDFKVRYPSLKLLNNLIRNRPKEMQEAILVTPNAVSKLMDMLSDNVEVIRNDTLLLLTDLTKGNTNLQKIVVFENAFDHLFSIVKEEGFADGGVVVGDCLSLMLTLLKNNPSNQTLFKEGSYIQKMAEFFSFPLNDEEVGWSAQKVLNVHYMLKLLRVLVSPHNSAQAVTSCQKVMKNCDLLQKLCTLLMAVGVPADILSDTILTVSDVIRGNQENQEYFSGVTAPSNPPRPAIVVLLMSMVNEKQPFILRCAVLYCFQCFLYRNPTSQGQIVQTLLPQTVQANEITAGQLLCGGLFSPDPVSCWFSAVALSHALLDNTNQKEQLLRVQLATGVGSPPVSLLQQCTSRLQGGFKILTRLGILQLLCMWLAHCPIAVTHLLNLPGVIPNLTAYLSSNEQDEMEIICQGVCAFLLGLCAYFNEGVVPSFTREALTNLVSNRIGVENFSDKVENVLRTEAYSRAAKSPQLMARQPGDVTFDHEFTKLFKSLEGSLLRTLMPEINGKEDEIPSAEVIRYKDIIREQEKELQEVKKTMAERESEVQKLKQDQEGLLNQFKELQINGGGSSTTPNGNHSLDIPNTANLQLVELQKQLEQMTHDRDYYYYYYYQMVEKESQMQSQQQVPNSSVIPNNPDLKNLQKQLEDLQLALYRKDEEIQRLREPSNALGEKNSESTEVQKLKEENLKLANYVKSLEDEKINSQFQVREAMGKTEEMETELRTLKSHDSVKKCAALESELERQKSEVEDLLVLLTDQETKISEMKRSLRSYGEVFSDDDEEDEDDDEGGINIDISSEEDDNLT